MFLLIYQSTFLPVYTVYKVQRMFDYRNFPFREFTNYTLGIKEQNYPTYALNAVTSRRGFGAKPTSQNVLNLTTTAYIHHFQWENKPRNQGLLRHLSLVL